MDRLFKLWIIIYIWFNRGDIEIGNGFYLLYWRNGCVTLCTVESQGPYFAQLMSYYFIKEWKRDNSLGIKHIGDFVFTKTKKTLEKTGDSC